MSSGLKGRLGEAPPAVGGGLSGAPPPLFGTLPNSAASPPAPAGESPFAKPFGAATAASFGKPPPPSTAGGGNDTDNDGKDATVSVQAKPVEGEEILFSAKAKLHRMVKGEGEESSEWKDFGVGHFSVRTQKKDEGGQSQPFVVFRTDSGRVLLNAAFYTGFSMTPMENSKGKTMSTIMFPSSEDGSQPIATNFLVRVKDADVAKRLQVVVKQHAV